MAELERLGPGGIPDERLVVIGLGLATAGVVDALGGIRGLATAMPTELIAAGVERSAALAACVGAEVARRAAAVWPSGRWLVRSPDDVAHRLMGIMAGLEREELRVLLLDTKNAVTAVRTVYMGNVAGSSVRVGEVFRDAVRACAAAIVIAHNHPSGDPTPSADDLRISAELAQAGRLLDIDLLDHLIIGRGRWLSLRALGALGQPPGTMR